MDIKKFMKETVLISEEATFKDALKSMKENHCNSLLVINNNGELV